MRHRVSGYKLGRDTEHRKAMFRNLAAGLIQHGQITTTLPKAKAVQPMVEKLITLARRGDLHARRRAIAILQDRKLAVVDKKTGDPIFEQYNDGRDKSLIQKLFDDVGPRYADRPGGYTRIIKLASVRIGDAAPKAILQLVGEGTWDLADDSIDLTLWGAHPKDWPLGEFLESAGKDLIQYRVAGTLSAPTVTAEPLHKLNQTLRALLSAEQ